MALNNTRTYTSVEDVLRDVWDSDFEVDSGSEFRDLSSEEEEMIDAGCDPEVESAVASETPPGSPQPGPSTAHDYDANPPHRRGRPPKRARPAPPSDNDDSDSDDDADVWNNSTDLDAEPYRMNFAPTREPGFQLQRPKLESI